MTDPLDMLIDAARGVANVDSGDREHRRTRRTAFDGQVALVQWTPGGGKSIPTVVDGKNLSSTGMCVRSRYMLHVGHEGAAMLLRTNGEQVLLGIKVMHSRYVGEMTHESGLQFIELPRAFAEDDFKDPQGNLPTLAPLKIAA